MTKGKKRVTLSAEAKARKKARFFSLFRSSPITIDDDDDSLTEIYYEESKSSLPNVDIISHEPWSFKYKPNSVGEMVGNHEELGRIRKFIEEWGRHEMNTVPLIYGRPGVGKTSLVYAIAKEMEYEVYEINCAVTSRIVHLTEKLHQSINNSQVSRGDAQISPWTASQDSMRQFSKVILNSKSLVLFDDIDCMVEEEETGFWKALNHLIQDSIRPIFLTATCHDHILESLVESLEKFTLEPPSDSSILTFLREICDREEQTLDKNLDASICHFHGDIRKAMNECQFYDGQLREIVQPEKVIDFDQRLHYDASCIGDLLSRQSENCVSSTEFISEYMKELNLRLFVKSECTHDTPQSKIPTSFRSKIREMSRKLQRTMNFRSVCLNFSPYLSIIECNENNRRYRTRGSKSRPSVKSEDCFIFTMNDT